MRPAQLFPLFADIQTLPGIGPRIKVAIARLAGDKVVDLLWHLPTGLVDRRARPKISQIEDGAIVTLEAVVDSHQPGATKRAPYRILLRDETGFLTLVFFHARTEWLQKTLPEGESRLVSGRVDYYQDRPQMMHPDYILKPDEADDLPLLEPLYPLTHGLGQKVVRRAIMGIVASAPALPEWHRSDILAKEGWSDWLEAVRQVHTPQAAGDLDHRHAARRRLAYDELLANQLALALVRHRARRSKGRPLVFSGDAKARILNALPYALTGDQAQALSEIEADMAAPLSMLRLVQGDVGSGKTIVAMLAMADAVEAGTQAVLLAPTEILARQHYETLSPLAEAADLRLDILTGRLKGRSRTKLLARLARGEIDILIGTHALLTGDVVFRDLAFVVVDEQHRFGVFQRLALADKAESGVDILVMTATPIPRTLTLTIYGDMDVSRIVEKPPGRKPVDTRVVSLDRLEEVADRVVRAAMDGVQIYWVCPLVVESENSDLAAAEDRYTYLQARLGDRVGLVHGRMKAAEKDAVMAAFAAGTLAVLVATTVIEVGVDVPNATIMVIEHAERFGLAQLHQLRGRVGRGGAQATCLLLRGPAGDAARARLSIMRETEDGFHIAEEDLRLRGAGEVLGTKQSGLPDFRLVDIETHGDLMAMARDDARLVIDTDPTLETARGEALRILLYLFERDAAIKYLKSG